MLSGTCPKDQLDELNVTVVLDQPFVGKGMQDNPTNGLFIPSPITVEPDTIHVGITAFGVYIENAGRSNFIFANPSDYQGYDFQVLHHN